MAETPPLSPHVPIADEQGRPTPEFLHWWQQQRGINGLVIPLTDATEVGAILDLIGDTRGALLVRGAAGWQVVLPGPAGYVLTSQGAGDDPTYVALPPSPPFTALPDTPADYVGAAGMMAAVNANEDGLEFVAGGADDFLTLTDTPADYTGSAGCVVAVKSSEDGLEFVAGGGGGGDVYKMFATPSPAPSSTESNNYGAKGFTLMPFVDNVKVLAVVPYMQPASGVTYRAFIAEMTDATKTSSVIEYKDFTLPAGAGILPVAVALDNPVVMDVGKRYFVGITSPTYAQQVSTMHYGGAITQIMSATPILTGQSARITGAMNPSGGDTIQTYSDATFCTGVIVEY